MFFNQALNEDVLKYQLVSVRLGCRVPTGAFPAEEPGESHEGSESKTVQHEAGGRDQQALQPTQSPSEILFI